MIIYEKNNDAQKHNDTVVNKVHAQVCKASSIPMQSEEANELLAFIEAEFKKGATDHKRLVDLTIAKINAADRIKRKNERISEK